MPFVPPPSLPDALAAEMPFERAAYRLEHGPDAGKLVHFVDHGPRSARPVLLLHGNPTWSFLWRQVIAKLPELRCVAPDLLGLGFSDHLAADEHSLDRHSGAVAELVAALDLQGVVLAAQDWGGPIGCAAAARAPERFAGRVFANTAVTVPKQPRGTWFHRFARLPVLPRVAFGAPGAMRLLFRTAQRDGSISGRVARAYTSVLRRHRGTFLALARMVPDSLDHPSYPALERGALWAATAAGPSELVWGENDPVLGRALRRHQATFPEARVTRTDAGHFLQEQVPDELAAAIQRVADAA